MKLDAKIIAQPQTRRIIVVGGGVIGIEIASELAYHYPEKRIQIMTRSSKLLRRCGNEKAHEKALVRLQELGVQVHFDDPVIDIQDPATNDPLNTLPDGSYKVECRSGRVLFGDYVVLATGPWPLSNLVTEHVLHPVSGRILVRPSLQLLSHDNIFAAGDVTSVDEAKTAYAACCAANTIARNITRLELGKSVLNQGEGGTRGGMTIPIHQKHRSNLTNTVDADDDEREDPESVGKCAMIVSLGGKQAMLVTKSRVCVSERWSWVKHKVQSRFIKVLKGHARSLPRIYGKGPEKLGPWSAEMDAMEDNVGETSFRERGWTTLIPAIELHFHASQARKGL